ncbi:hypothetical protein Acsp04_58860 [Actinomadura sp. NBRC 104425]|uniref:hypothetical protein n=1 Tax=Actinomadura sp. NBRC 104425 TaxID=3032204 RepID=UPI0024A2317D|nr:hypothetical protein [Actinomadura sp. NBRC 104425]GLZ15651.1 hypothetical protein Acsp04_58860 [Actinomadura sp. NBRC 104425]
MYVTVVRDATLPRFRTLFGAAVRVQEVVVRDGTEYRAYRWLCHCGENVIYRIDGVITEDQALNNAREDANDHSGLCRVFPE